jgi:hypothetical protein
MASAFRIAPAMEAIITGSTKTCRTLAPKESPPARGWGSISTLSRSMAAVSPGGPGGGASSQGAAIRTSGKRSAQTSISRA